MCIPALLAALAPAAGGATAAGAAAGAATGLAKALQVGGTLLSVGGSLYQGMAANSAAKAQAAHLDVQATNERTLTAIEDHRTRGQFRSQIRQQAAELAARGINLGSPTAVLLGQTAAREMSFASQSVRARGQARQQEITSQRRAVLAQGRMSLLRGGASAAATALTAAPEIWPGLRSVS